MFTLDCFSLKGKKAIITGGTGGLCGAIARAYHALGAEVVLWGRSEQGRRIAEDMGSADAPVWFVSCDLEHSAQISGALAESLRCLDGRVDILVNGAGLQHRASALEFPEEQWRKIIEVNLSAMFFISQQVGRIMCEQGAGRIINIASMCSFFGGVRIPAYSASKGGVAQLTKALSNEWAAKGIRINAIAPGYMETAITRDLQRNDPEQYSQITARIPEGRWGKPEDLQGLAVFLASDAAEYISGAVIPLDGGYLGK